jgi:hypothetical protein
MLDYCNDSTYLYDFIYLRNSDDSSFIYECGKSQLIDTGEYFLSLTEIGEVKIKLVNTCTYIDTFYYPMINELFGVTSGGGYYGFFQCNRPCNGIMIDYYKKGIKRLEGEFKNGVPVGYIRFYYPTGILQEVREYSRLFHRFKRAIFYDVNGEIANIEEKGYRIRVEKTSVPNSVYKQ